MFPVKPVHHDQLALDDNTIKPVLRGHLWDKEKVAS